MTIVRIGENTQYYPAEHLQYMLIPHIWVPIIRLRHAPLLT
jgi:hypothetical protein